MIITNYMLVGLQLKPASKKKKRKIKRSAELGTYWCEDVYYISTSVKLIARRNKRRVIWYTLVILTTQYSSQSAFFFRPN